MAHNPGQMAVPVAKAIPETYNRAIRFLLGHLYDHGSSPTEEPFSCFLDRSDKLIRIQSSQLTLKIPTQIIG